jgi:adenylate cyclase
MMTNPAPTGVAELIEWLSGDECHDIPDAAMLSELGRRLRALGLPLDRLSLHLRTLHPQILARTLAWTEGEPVELRDRDNSIERLPFFAGNPIRRATEERRWLSLSTPEEIARLEELDFFQSRNLAVAEVVPLVMGQGPASAVVFATRRPEGFGPDGRTLLQRIVPALRSACEIRMLQLAEATLLDTYVGPLTGRRILEGHIRRGDVETLKAALLLCDLRDFTVLSNRLPPEQMLDRLNLYFDQLVPPITAHGGEVLKFMGDGLLAIFPIDASGVHAGKSDIAIVCNQALAAARQVEAEVAAADWGGLEEPGGVKFGVALHVGELLYGNVGSTNRLDFTCIGPAVNLAARIEALSGEIGQTILASAEFAKACGGMAPLGSFALKGVAAEQVVYGVA